MWVTGEAIRLQTPIPFPDDRAFVNMYRDSTVKLGANASYFRLIRYMGKIPTTEADPGLIQNRLGQPDIGQLGYREIRRFACCTAITNVKILVLFGT